MTAGAPVPELAKELAEAHMRNDPFEASSMGVSGHDDAVPDLSLDAQQSWHDSLVDVLARCDQLEASARDSDGRVLLAATRAHAMRELATMDSRVLEFSVTPAPIRGPSRMLFIAARTSITDAPSALSYLGRCRKFRTYLDQDAERLRAAAAANLLPVAPLVDQAIKQLRRYLAHPARDPLLMNRPPQGWDGAATWRDNLERVVRDDVRPAVARYLDLLLELLPKSRPQDLAGLVHMQGGAEAYACCVRNGTTLVLDPEQVYEIGMTVLTEANLRIAELGARAFSTRGAGQVIARLREDASQSTPSDLNAMVRAAAAIARAEQRLPEIIRPPFPPACAIEPMPPHIAESGAQPMYSAPARDGTRAGAYLFNRTYPGPASRWALETVAFHEAVPGHHTQFARLQLMPDLPLLLTAFEVVPHSEGWGLYAEQLADEFDLYSDDVQRLGMLAAIAWRAVRLIVDSGLHARGWSRTMALRFALAHTPMPETFMTTEIDRYIARPGQALGYLIGKREILRLREDARSRLGAAFEIRDFHSAVLDHGVLPLNVLSEVVRKWAKSVTTHNNNSSKRPRAE